MWALPVSSPHGVCVCGFLCAAVVESNLSRACLDRNEPENRLYTHSVFMSRSSECYKFFFLQMLHVSSLNVLVCEQRTTFIGEKCHANIMHIIASHCNLSYLNTKMIIQWNGKRNENEATGTIRWAKKHGKNKWKISRGTWKKLTTTSIPPIPDSCLWPHQTNKNTCTRTQRTTLHALE